MIVLYLCLYPLKGITMNNFNIISPTTGEKYTLLNLIHKLVDRSNFIINKLEWQVMNTCAYQSHQALLHFEFETISPTWNNSLEGSIEGSLPIHFSQSGKQSLGWFPVTNERYKPDISPEEILGRESIDINFYGDLEGEQDNIFLQVSPSKENWDDETYKVLDLLFNVAHKAAFQTHFKLQTNPVEV